MNNINNSEISNNIKNNHHIFMNNHKNSNLINESDSQYIWDNIFSNDKYIENRIYNLINNSYQKKINLINLILQSNIFLPLKKDTDIIKFFNWICPLNLEYNMSSRCWNFSTLNYGNKSSILIQNSISKLDSNEYFYLNYINKIKKILSNSKIKYYYFEFKSKRFNKIKDIIWTIII